MISNANFIKGSREYIGDEHTEMVQEIIEKLKKHQDLKVVVLACDLEDAMRGIYMRIKDDFDANITKLLESKS